MTPPSYDGQLDNGQLDEGELDRAYGALLGLAVGDALGMPTQMLAYDEVARRFGVLDRFHAGAPDHPIAAGLRAGRVTDDTEQAVILGRLLVAGRGRLDVAAYVAALQAWEERMVAAGSGDLLGPSTRRALRAIAGGVDVAVAGQWGETNGAAMRIAPVGIAVPAEPLAPLVDQVVAVSRPTHGTGLALAGAGAVAAAVSTGVSGHPFEVAVDTAVRAAADGATRGSYVAGADVGTRIRWAVDVVTGLDPIEMLTRISSLVGTSLATQESVPAAFAIASLFPTDPWEAARHAASLGGDADTIAAIAGAIVGACCGGSAFPEALAATVEAVNPDLGLAALAADLLALRG